MKNQIYPIALALCLAITWSFGCESAEQKDAAAAAKVKEAQEDLKDARQDATVASQQLATAEEWRLYKATIEEKIVNNEDRIADLQVQLKKPGRKMDEALAQRIHNLEQANKDLRIRLDNYGRQQSDWNAFKREFNHDMEELGKALNELTVDNKN